MVVPDLSSIAVGLLEVGGALSVCTIVRILGMTVTSFNCFIRWHVKMTSVPHCCSI